MLTSRCAVCPWWRRAVVHMEVHMTQASLRRDTAADQSSSDHANVVVRPPVLWVLLVAAGIGLDFLVPLPFMPAGFPAVWVGSGAGLAGLALAALAFRQFRRAGTEVQPHTPTAVIVDTGVFAFSRNPMYLGAHIGIVGIAIAFDSLWVLSALVPSAMAWWRARKPIWNASSATPSSLTRRGSGAGSRSEVMLTLIVYRRLCSALSVGRRSPSLRLAKLGLPPRGPR